MIVFFRIYVWEPSLLIEQHFSTYKLFLTRVSNFWRRELPPQQFHTGVTSLHPILFQELQTETWSFISCNLVYIYNSLFCNLHINMKLMIFPNLFLWQFVCSQESKYANIFLLVRLVSVCQSSVFLWKQKWRQKSDWMEVLCLVYTFVFSPEPNRNSLTQDIFLKSKLGPSNKIITYNWLKTYNTNIRWMFIF